MNQTERTERRELIEQHPDFQATYDRWHSVAIAAGRSKAEAHERAYGLAYNWIGRRIDMREGYLGRRRIGPPVEAR